MSTTWPSLTANDLVSGEGAETVGALLFDQQEALTSKGTSIVFADQSTTSATYATVITLRYRVPKWATVGKTIRFYVRSWQTGGVGTGNFRINNGATNGTDGANTTSATPGSRFSDLTIQSGWPATIIDINVQGKTTAGTVNISGEQITGNLRVLD